MGKSVEGFYLLIAQGALFGFSLHGAFYYGQPFDAVRSFMFICFGVSLGTLLSSIIMNIKRDL